MSKERRIVTSPIEFSASQLWEWIKNDLGCRKGLFHIDQCDEDVKTEIDYEMGSLIAAHLTAVANPPVPDRLAALESFAQEVLHLTVLTHEPSDLDWMDLHDIAMKTGLVVEREVPGDCGLECSGDEPHNHYFGSALLWGEERE